VTGNKSAQLFPCKEGLLVQNKWNIDYIVTFSCEKIKKKYSIALAPPTTGRADGLLGPAFCTNSHESEMCCPLAI
jgi:hypothetical protein